MELLEKAKTNNDFGLRKRFPWSDSAQFKPWMEFVSEDSEESFVKGILAPIFSTKSPRIYRVENPYLWGRYVLAFEELNANSNSGVSEHHVIHATSLTNAMTIADINFDWRRVTRARFGRGVSFSRSASYAQKYASNKNVYIIAGIPISTMFLGHYGTRIPYGDCDTTVDSRGNVYVKYYDNDFYPYYIVLQ